MHATRVRCLAAIMSILAVPAISFAVIVIDAGGFPSRNLSAPSGLLTDSGWQYQGNWGAFLGTPISPDCFITAAHINPDNPAAPDRPDAVLGNDFIFGGLPYKTISYDTAPNADLRIWHIQGTFPTYAPLYTGSAEVGQNAVIFGRGVPASSNITVGANLKGWGWTTSSYDGLRNWGTNTVVDAITDPSLGRFLVTLFDPVIGQNEGQLAFGDSGGGVFINDGGTWKLAGLNYSVDGPYKYALTDTSSFQAALFDQSGLYVETGPGTFGPAPDRPSASYLTSISGNLDWIGTIVPSAVPEPATAAVLAGSALFLLRRQRWITPK